ncbi:MAG TPA: hypothetical protein VF881_03440 [Polyangiaceae bacterium]
MLAHPAPPARAEWAVSEVEEVAPAEHLALAEALGEKRFAAGVPIT